MKWFSWISLFFLFACSKNNLDFEVQNLTFPENQGIEKVLFTDELNGWACGGEIWETGFIYNTTDGGQSWSLIHSAGDVINDFVITNQHIVAVGNSGQIIVIGDTSSLTINTDEFPHFNQIIQLESEEFIVVGGDGYNKGYILNFNLNDTTYRYKKYPANIQCVSNTGNAIRVGGYGLVGVLNLSDLSYDSEDIRGDFFIDFGQRNQELYCIGYQGKVFKSNHVNIWEQVDRKKSPFTAVENLTDIDFNGAVGFITGQNGSLHFTKNGSDWNTVNMPTSLNLLSVSVVNNLAFVSGENGYLAKIWYE